VIVLGIETSCDETAVALVEENALEGFLSHVARTYKAATGIEAKLYVSAATDGVTINSIAPEAASQQ
jgi:tRNA A37 threonylcarbamoyltransferase TsaD